MKTNPRYLTLLYAANNFVGFCIFNALKKYFVILVTLLINCYLGLILYYISLPRELQISLFSLVPWGVVNHIADHSSMGMSFRQWPFIGEINTMNHH
jgi:hypothetical protein